MNFVFFILILVILILVHELGHFLVAKWLRIKVEEFAIGFPPRMFSVQKGETTYSFNWILFGGYVKMLGENEPAGGNVSVFLEEKVADDRSFAFASGWKQATITLAGVGMNFLFAWLAFIVVFMAGIEVDAAGSAYPEHLRDPHVGIAAVAPDSPAAEAGLKPGDAVAGVTSASESLPQGFTSENFQQFTYGRADTDIMLQIERAGETQQITVRPETGIVEGRAAIGVELADLATEQLPPHLAVVRGSESFVNATQATVVGLGAFFGSILRGQGDFSEVAGPVGIATIGAQSVEAGFSMAILFAAIISLNLAILNLLPIPGLDGGRLLFIVIERLKGSPISSTLAMRITIAGFALLATLMILVTFHDIARLV